MVTAETLLGSSSPSAHIVSSKQASRPKRAFTLSSIGRDGCVELVVAARSKYGIHLLSTPRMKARKFAQKPEIRSLSPEPSNSANKRLVPAAIAVSTFKL